MVRVNIAENVNRLSKVNERYRQMTTDRQADLRRHTFGQNASASSSEHAVMRLLTSHKRSMSDLLERTMRKVYTVSVDWIRKLGLLARSWHFCCGA